MNLGKLSKPIVIKIVILLMVRSVLSLEVFPRFCQQCEEEVWEEVPCSEIARSTTTTTSTTLSTSTTSSTSTTTTTTTLRTSSTASSFISSIENSNEFRRCYCECKVGCRDYCRKVIVNADSRKPLNPYYQNFESLPQDIIIRSYRQRKPQVPYRNPYPVDRYENSYRVENSEETNKAYAHSKIIAPINSLPIPIQYKKLEISSGNPISASSISEYTNPATVHIPYNPEPNYQSYTSEPQKILNPAKSCKDRKSDPAFETVLDSYMKNFVYPQAPENLIKSRYSPNQPTYSVTY